MCHSAILIPCGVIPLWHPLQLLLVALAGWINQQQRDVIDYLQALAKSVPAPLMHPQPQPGPVTTRATSS